MAAIADYVDGRAAGLPIRRVDVASLAPNAEITVFPWKTPPELKERTIERVRKFIQTHGAAPSG